MPRAVKIQYTVPSASDTLHEILDLSLAISAKAGELKAARHRLLDFARIDDAQKLASTPLPDVAAVAALAHEVAWLRGKRRAARNLIDQKGPEGTYARLIC